ncbi:MAG: integrase [Mesorhizobium sp.]|uniref:tyrosine-type recombinase/integrase n=1 Tax=Mesorhizobium sp. TaxID=1871066 RepID=UPI000FE37D1E|nr:tyrosine-type recombinase/integrase [Mesorhizobium sp.]RWJ58250.1 MAG: integrase [Mesorhizobium sp.]TIO74042.1 MAG: integrase [Mesorhizobium sp.]
MSDSKLTPSFPSLLQRFFIAHLGNQRAVSSRTIAAYRDTFRLLLGFAEATIGTAPTRLTLADLDAQLILGFLDHLEKERSNGARTRNARLAALRSFLKYAAHYDLTALPVIEQVLAIPMKRFDRPVLGFLSREEMQAILDAPDARTWAGERDRALFSMMYNTGARVPEAIGLRVGEVVVDGSAVAHLHGKGRKDRSVPLWRTTANLIRNWKRRLDCAGEENFLFPNRGGGCMARSNFTQRLELAVSAAAERYPQLARRSVSPHTIRHTTAMRLLQSGIDISVIALWLGHESPATTHMYLQADLTMKERTLNRLLPMTASQGRYRPPDQLMQFLLSL